METIQATLKRIAYQVPPKRWGSFRFENEQLGRFTVVGDFLDPIVGTEYEISGEWGAHEKYGKQFQINSIEPFVRTADNNGKAPEGGVRERLHMMCGSKLTPVFINNMIEKYGENAVSVLKNNPYQLMEDFEDTDFERADYAALSTGLSPDAMVRIKAIICHILTTEANKNGLCCYCRPNLETSIREFIPDISDVLISDTISEMASAPDGEKTALTIDSDGAIYLRTLYLSEDESAKRVCDMVEKGKSYAERYTLSDIEAATKEIQRKTGIVPEESQMEAVLMSLNNGISIITGGPGTGKTTVIRTILEALHAKEPKARVALMAPTGHASVRMSDVTGLPATTIHSKLALRDNGDLVAIEMKEDVIIVDEASMIDIRLAAALLRCVNPNSRLIFVGDADQLPPVGPGAFFHSLAESDKVPTSRLKFSFRQSGLIAQNAQKINLGEDCNTFDQDDTFRIVAATKQTGPEKAIEEYVKMVKDFGIDDTILLSPTRKQGEDGTDALNRRIQEKLNPDEGQASLSFEDDGATNYYRVNDRVMLHKNLWRRGGGYVNGDTGTIVEISGNNVLVRFDNGSKEWFTDMEVKSMFTLAYACTIHKAQGSEYKGVVILFTPKHASMGKRNLIYTAETRARERVCIVGNTKFINAAISTMPILSQNSKLKERIDAYISQEKKVIP